MAVDRFDFGCVVFAFGAEFTRLQRILSAKAGLYAGQPRVLTMLREHEGCSLKELSRVCNIGMPSLSVSVRNMEKSGLIRREGASRSPQLYLTDAGREKAQDFHVLIDQFFEGFLASLPERDGEQLNDLMDYFTKYMTEFDDRQ